MVYCTKCGAQNPDTVKFCAQCRSRLYGVAPPSADWERRMEAWGEDFGRRMEAWGEDFGRRVEQECFGLPHRTIGVLMGLLFGAFLIIIGVGVYFRLDVWRWFGPFMLLILGFFLIIGSIYGLRRRSS